MGPFDRFNDRAKRVLALAQDEAIRFGHNYIGTEHLLLGLVREGESVAARVLASLGIELSKARTAVEFMIGRGRDATAPSEITLNPRVKKVIELAIDESRKLGHSHVGPEHLLLGIVREGEGIALGVLESLGVPLEKVRHQVIATLGQQAAPPGLPRKGGPFDAFADAAKRTLALAQDEAAKMRHNWIGTEHLLLGVLRASTPAAVVLNAAGIDLEAARAAILAVVPRGAEGPEIRDMTLTPRTKRVIELAVGEASGIPGQLVTPEHLLVALIDEVDGIAAGVLASLGKPAEIRAAVVRRLGPPTK